MKEDFRNSSILIAGLGLIGGSVAKALKKAGFNNLYAFDTDAQTIKSAKKDGVIRKGYARLNDDVPAFDFILCCLSPGFVVPFYENVKRYLKYDGVFAEVGGIKTVIIKNLLGAMQTEHQLLSLHPMAGSEKSGYSNSDDKMFSDSVLILTPTPKTADKALGWSETLKTVMGCNSLCRLSAKEHDKIIAYVSHIPHIAALAVKAMDDDSGYERFSGGSLKAITRVADINSELWAGLLTDNAEYLLESIALLKQKICVLEQAVGKGDAPALKKLLDDISGK